MIDCVQAATLFIRVVVQGYASPTSISNMEGEVIGRLRDFRTSDSSARYPAHAPRAACRDPGIDTGYTLRTRLYYVTSAGQPPIPRTSCLSHFLS